MNVDTVGAAALDLGLHRRNPEQQIQDVFSQVLATAGREGYASASTAAHDAQPLAKQISGVWSDWFTGELSTGCYRGTIGADALKQSYGEILVSAYQDSGHVDPRSFLSQLSTDELAVVQRVHHLADPIKTSELSEEGALNLLLPPPAQVDMNRDGLTRSGAAYGIRFPDSNTPADVAEAWDQATKGMDLRDRMIYEFQMKLPLLTANLVCDDEGRYVHHYEPGDPEFTNPMASDDYSYIGAVDDRIGYLDYFKNSMAPDRYERDMDFWASFRDLLLERGGQ